jgi:DNA-binding GntR family transcriptional regulator
MEQELLSRRGLNVRELARELGVSERTVRRALRSIEETFRLELVTHHVDRSTFWRYRDPDSCLFSPQMRVLVLNW